MGSRVNPGPEPIPPRLWSEVLLPTPLPPHIKGALYL
ncbi:predicted protein [Plenodomus lingam JN3]|uniref:Predicted protein n=1 Tax=Leptosphaeria maculans (strain JN3 / isolate v23.1.3 / race Av1-4-5-6-7-8) TaxID=985895 RepID=E4ZSC3_LEPMJ|nr:predicted protein [Plenodomus lingam JN3]CBX94303.1 predicted protein [Plenodomus lingam JN3]